MLQMILGLMLLLGIHSVALVSPTGRDRLAARLGEGPWKGLYSLVAVAGLWLVVGGFAAARAAGPVLYASNAAMRGAAMVLMLLALPCLWASFLPGAIQRTLRHPMLAATKAWAVAHLLANGSAADVVLFGSLLVWAVAERISLKRRPERARAMAPPSRYNDGLAIVLGLASYAILVGGLHRWLFGVAPFG